MSENKIQTKTGKVVRKKFGVGSKSEHQAYFLLTESGEQFVLRRRGENPYMDEFFGRFTDKKVTCTGEIVEYVFYVSAENISEV